MQMWHFAQSRKRKTRANSETREKGKEMLTEGGDVKRTSENTIHYLKIVTFLATRNTDSSITDSSINP